jgi:hypothetical protein
VVKETRPLPVAALELARKGSQSITKYVAAALFCGATRPVLRRHGGNLIAKDFIEDANVNDKKISLLGH